MAIRTAQRLNPDRWMTARNGIYYYKRRVPKPLRELDTRGEHIRISLGTDDLAEARRIRDVYEQADNELWASMLTGSEADASQARYQAAMQRAKAMGFTYRPAPEIAKEQLESILQRVEALVRADTPKAVIEAALGTIDQPTVTLSKAFEIYRDKIVPHQLASKSKGQRKRWLDGKLLSVNHFIEVVGDLAMDEITREHGRKYFDHWMEKIAPKESKPTHTADSGNRRIGDLRVLYREYFSHMKQEDRLNPFDKLSFKRKGKKRRKRPSFSLDWITKTILKPGALAGLNDEARGILLVVADIGARPSEICNLTPDRIILSHNIPHLKIEPDEDPEDPREIKTETSVRVVPLTGMALAVMRRFPNGFPRYRDKESSLSAALNKYLTENKLRETPKHSVYSFRHSFEDRMKEVKVDSEIRRILMGHTVDRPEYGEGGSLQLRLDAMTQVALPFDPVIVGSAQRNIAAPNPTATMST